MEKLQQSQALFTFHSYKVLRGWGTEGMLHSMKKCYCQPGYLIFFFLLWSIAQKFEKWLQKGPVIKQVLNICWRDRKYVWNIWISDPIHSYCYRELRTSGFTHWSSALPCTAQTHKRVEISFSQQLKSWHFLTFECFRCGWWPCRASSSRDFAGSSQALGDRNVTTWVDKEEGQTLQGYVQGNGNFFPVS